MPSDLWNIDHPSLPHIQLLSQRMSIDNNSSSVDVMRFFVLGNWKSMLSIAAKRAALRPGFTQSF